MSQPSTSPLSPSIELLTRVASMYYLEDMTQEKIAAQLGLSRPKVWRLLTQAKESGIVQITVNLHPSLSMPLETELCERFGLTQAVLVSDQRDDDALRSQIGRAAADVVDRLLREGGTIAVGMGRNVKAVSQQAEGARRRAVTVVSAIGGSAQMAGDLNSNDIAGRLAEAMGGSAEGIYAPAYTGSAAERDAFLGHADVRRSVDRARAADLAIVGIGDADDDSLVVRLGCITREEMARMRSDGAVGDILGSFFNLDGHPVAEWIEERVVGVSGDDLRRIPTVVAVVSEETKASAIVGVLRSGLVDVLVSSAATARRVLEIAGPPAAD